MFRRSSHRKQRRRVSEDPVAPRGDRRRFKRRVRLSAAGGLLALSLVIAVVQAHAGRRSAPLVSPYIQSVALPASDGSIATLTIAEPLTWGTYSVDLVLPDHTSPLDYGIAYHEIRKHVKVTVRQADRPTPLLVSPNAQTLTQLEDQLSICQGVELCDFPAQSAAELTVTCQIADGIPWPDQVRVGISHSADEGKIRSAGQLTKAVQPISFGASALLFCLSVLLCWRTSPS
ncbi:MAG: hypothetical protein JWL69_10 [Phycisphaerales bacterium]|nr:hypothetical protein [Phycisphaerales bacterium]